MYLFGKWHGPTDMDQDDVDEVPSDIIHGVITRSYRTYKMDFVRFIDAPRRDTYVSSVYDYED